MGSTLHSKKRVLLVPAPVMSHYRPFIPIGVQLRERGCEVAAIALCDLPQYRSLGMSTYPVPHPTIEVGASRSAIIKDHAAVLEWNRRVRIRGIADNLEQMVSAIDEFRPDVMLVDGQVWSAYIAAHRSGVPAATLATNLMLHLWQFESSFRTVTTELEPECLELFDHHGIADAQLRAWECLSRHLNVTLATDVLLDGEPMPPHGLLGGPAIAPVLPGEGSDFPMDRLRSDRPIVYVAFGAMIYHQPDLITTIARAAAPLGVQCVVACGELASSSFPSSLPGDVLCVPFAPQPELLGRVAVAVSHAGANTVMECCFHGVPMLALPLTSDGYANADLVARKGLGVSRPAGSLHEADARVALERLLDPAEGFAERLAPVRASYRRPEWAAGLCERVIQMAG